MIPIVLPLVALLVLDRALLCLCKPSYQESKLLGIYPANQPREILALSKAAFYHAERVTAVFLCRSIKIHAMIIL